MKYIIKELNVDREMPMCLKRTGAEKQEVTSRKQDSPTHD